MFDVGRFEREDLRGVNVEDARDCSRFEGLGDEVDELPMSSTGDFHHRHLIYTSQSRVFSVLDYLVPGLA